MESILEILKSERIVSFRLSSTKRRLIICEEANGEEALNLDKQTALKMIVEIYEIVSQMTEKNERLQKTTNNQNRS